MEQSFKLPDLGEGIHEGEILDVKIALGDVIKEGEIIFVVETDKAAVEIPSPYSGQIKKLNIKRGDIVGVGTVLVVFSTDAPQEGPAPPSQTATASTGKAPTPASPATRRLARELGVDINQVQASDPSGLVTADDVRNFTKAGGGEKNHPVTEPTKNHKESRQPPPTPEPSPTKMQDFKQWGEIEQLPLKSIRKAIAKKMALSWAQIPHVSHQDAVDITNLEAIRTESKAEVEKHDGKLTLTIFAFKAVVGALENFPKFNASLDLENEVINLKKYYNLSIAIDTERGLVAPVIKDVNKKSMLELAIELPKLSQKARKGELSQEDLSGGTFTITNIGAIGGTGFQPIINFPEVAILGLGKAVWKPIVREDKEGKQGIIPRLMLPVVLSFDHRVLDGAEAARFVNEIKKTLENPASMLFHE